MKNSSLIIAFLLFGIAASGQISSGFTSKTRVCAATPFALTSTATGANAYHWLVDGGHYSTHQDTVIEFFTPCSTTHYISLVAINTLQATSDTFTKLITVLGPNCTGNFTLNYFGCYGDTFTYYSHSDAEYNLWEFTTLQDIIDGCTSCDHISYKLVTNEVELKNTITYEGGCEDEVFYNHTFCPSGWLTVGDVAEGDAITIAPNPVSDKATLKFDNAAGKRHTFTLYNMEGRIVRQIKNITGSELQLSRDGLSAGSYFYSLSSADGNTARGKVFIQ